MEILAGAAGKGKTARLLDEYRKELDSARRDCRPGTTLWLAPTFRARRAVLSRLLDGPAPACFAPNVYTFEAFAERILQSSQQNVKRIADVARRTLVKNIVDELARRRQLSYFAPISETPGFLDLVLGFISELKRDETWPEQFTQACRARGESDKDHELALIYNRYQQQLLEHGLYDAEGRFWSARAALQAGEAGPFGDLSLVVVDGFADFTHTQYEILAHLAHLAGRCGRMLVSLPLELPLVRSDLFAKSEAARRRLQQVAIHAGVASSVEDCSRRHAAAPPALQHLADSLFQNPRNVERLSEAAGIEILAATGQLGEVESLAERVKRLLLDGVPPGDVVVAFRSLGEYAELVDEVFTAAGIPFWCEARRPLGRDAALKTLFSVVEMELEDWPFDRLMAVLDSHYVRAGWPELHGGSAARSVAAALRQRKLHAGRRDMLQALAAAARHTADNGSAETARIALELLKRLSEATGRLRTTNEFGGWAATLVELARQLGIAPIDHDAVVSADQIGGLLDERDRRNWETFERVLFDAAAAHSYCDEPPQKLRLDQFAARLSDLLANQTVPPVGTDKGRVLVLDAAQVRSLDVQHLFLAGLSEASFPRVRRDDCLYSEAERKRLNEHGLALGHRSSHSQDEMLLFYQVVTRARRQLVLSYPAVSAGGQPLFPSPYVSAVRELFEAAALPPTHVGQLDPVPPAESVLTARDLRLVATVEARQHRPALFCSMLDLPSTSSAAANILAAAQMADARFHTRGFTNYEGLLRDAHNLAALREAFGREYEFSATQLERYAACPFQFFLSDILKIEPLESPQVATDYLARGALVHDVLAALHQAAARDAAADAADFNTETIAAQFSALVQKKLGKAVDESQLQQALIKIEKQLLEEWGTAYGGQLASYFGSFRELWDELPRPAHFEVPFGNVRRRDDEDDRRLEPLTLRNGDEVVRICGRIDRIDVGKSDERLVFNVIDYKSGGYARFGLEELALGQSLQLALYTLAVQRLGLVGDDALPFQMGYWSLKERGFVSGFKTQKRKMSALDDAVLQSLETTLEQLVPRLAAGIRGGAFPVFNRDQNCTRLCPYSSVCRVNQIRPLSDALDKTWEP